MCVVYALLQLCVCVCKAVVGIGYLNLTASWQVSGIPLPLPPSTRITELHLAFYVVTGALTLVFRLVCQALY